MTIAKRLLLLASLVLVAGAAAAFVASLRAEPNDAQDAEVASFDASFSTTDAYIESLQVKLQRDPNDAATMAQLGAADLQKARETGNPAFYSKAEELLNNALALDAENPDALRGLAAVALARHDFQGGLELAQRSRDIDPARAGTYGLIGDALVELGRYDEAFDAFQQMIDLKPDLSSYARASYARELYGDVDGAEGALRLAVESGGGNGESAAWAHLQLGNLYYNHADLDGAQAEYEASIAAFPGYVHGNAGLAKVKAARGDISGAIELYRNVVERYPVLEYVVALGDLYATHGDAQLAREQYALVEVINQLLRSNGVNSDLELALYYADHDINLDDALRQARAEYERRPSVHAADILSWALFKNGNYSEALQYSDRARRLGTRDASFAFHAAMIQTALGNTTEASSLFAQTLATNPHFSPIYASVAAEELRQLEPVRSGS